VLNRYRCSVIIAEEIWAANEEDAKESFLQAVREGTEYTHSFDRTLKITKVGEVDPEREEGTQCK